MEFTIQIIDQGTGMPISAFGCYEYRMEMGSTARKGSTENSDTLILGKTGPGETDWRKEVVSPGTVAYVMNARGATVFTAHPNSKKETAT